MYTLREKIAQMLIIGFAEEKIEAHSPIVDWLTTDGLGGVILFDYNMETRTFDKNLKSREQIQQLNHQLQKLNRKDLLNDSLGSSCRLKEIPRCTRDDVFFSYVLLLAPVIKASKNHAQN